MQIYINSFLKSGRDFLHINKTTSNKIALDHLMKGVKNFQAVV